jgi:hypothetical protein
MLSLGTVLAKVRNARGGRISSRRHLASGEDSVKVLTARYRRNRYSRQNLPHSGRIPLHQGSLFADYRKAANNDGFAARKGKRQTRQLSRVRSSLGPLIEVGAGHRIA